MTKHLRLAIAAFSAVALLLAGCADDDGAVDTVDTEETDTDLDTEDDTDLDTEDDDLLEDDDTEG
jgi:PBP1b-binding outer membrane lipoprotein LpoB